MDIETTQSGPVGCALAGRIEELTHADVSYAVSVNIDAVDRARRALDAAERRVLLERARNGAGDG